MHQIPPYLQCVVAADRPRRRLGRFGRSDGRARRHNRIAAGQGHHHHRRRCDVLDQPGKEGAFAVRIVVFLRQVAANAQQLHADNFQAALLKAFDNLAGQAALHGVGFDDDKRVFQEIAFPLESFEKPRRNLTGARVKCVCGTGGFWRNKTAADPRCKCVIHWRIFCYDNGSRKRG